MSPLYRINVETIWTMFHCEVALSSLLCVLTLQYTNWFITPFNSISYFVLQNTSLSITEYLTSGPKKRHFVVQNTSLSTTPHCHKILYIVTKYLTLSHCHRIPHIVTKYLTSSQNTSRCNKLCINIIFCSVTGEGKTGGGGLRKGALGNTIIAYSWYVTYACVTVYSPFYDYDRKNRSKCVFLC